LFSKAPGKTTSKFKEKRVFLRKIGSQQNPILVFGIILKPP